MKKIFVCSPYIGNMDIHCPSTQEQENEVIEQHLFKAKAICRAIVLGGDIPIAPHLYFTQFLNDKNEVHRRLGINAGLELLKECEKVAVFTICCGTSKGMKIELDLAKKLGITIIEVR